MLQEAVFPPLKKASAAEPYNNATILFQRIVFYIDFYLANIYLNLFLLVLHFTGILGLYFIKLYLILA